MLDVITALYVVMMNNVIFDVLTYSTVIDGSVLFILYYQVEEKQHVQCLILVLLRKAFSLFFDVLT